MLLTETDGIEESRTSDVCGLASRNGAVSANARRGFRLSNQNRSLPVKRLSIRFDAEKCANAAEIAVRARVQRNFILIAIKLDGHDKFC